ncbi:proton-conducting transporter membrane subunit [Komagataeibacter rhaeticus]|nr:proton-conducting transporter membrane subunit [Komagataeibacter rhaeticus]
MLAAGGLHPGFWRQAAAVPAACLAARCLYRGPTTASVMLSGVLSKAGAYGLLRFGVLMFPDAARLFAPVVLTLGVIAVIYAAIIALAQTDMKRVIAYSSFSHMGVIAIGLFTMTPEGLMARFSRCCRMAS